LAFFAAFFAFFAIGLIPPFRSGFDAEELAASPRSICRLALRFARADPFALCCAPRDHGAVMDVVRELVLFIERARQRLETVERS
jgi:hypothetical protein